MSARPSWHLLRGKVKKKPSSYIQSINIIAALLQLIRAQIAIVCCGVFVLIINFENYYFNYKLAFCQLIILVLPILFIAFIFWCQLHKVCIIYFDVSDVIFMQWMQIISTIIIWLYVIREIRELSLFNLSSYSFIFMFIQFIIHLLSVIPLSYKHINFKLNT